MPQLAAEIGFQNGILYYKMVIQYKNQNAFCEMCESGL